MELITGLLQIVADTLLISKGKYSPTWVSWPIAALCFALFGLFLGGMHLWLNTAISPQSATALYIGFFTLATAFIHVNRHQLGFPLSKGLALIYSLSLALGAALIIYLAAS